MLHTSRSKRSPADSSGRGVRSPTIAPRDAPPNYRLRRLNIMGLNNPHVPGGTMIP